ncbi:MAG: PEP-CTERM sorting domain-containing protein [Armatimonadetes bacterium]|nr:PEP-CTERM sorting domain-containing protein [Armatimonadota bacterium]
MKGLVAVICLLTPASCTQAAQYTLTDLSALSGGREGWAFDVNNSGVAVGYRTGSDGYQHAFLYDGTMHDLGSLPGYPNSVATGINDLGDVVGYLRPAGGSADYHAFLYKNGKMTDLGTIPNYTYWTLANAINNSGVIAGTAYSYTYTSGFQGHAFLYDGQGIHDLNNLTFGGSTSVEANAINNSGQVVGSTGPNGSAFLWHNGTMTDLGTLWGGSYSDAFGINDSGKVVGQSYAMGGIMHAFLYDGTMHDLGLLSGYTQSRAYGINNSGEAVGQVYLDFNNKHAFIYKQGAMYDLNALIGSASGFTLQNGYAINDIGQIVGYGTDSHNAQHAFLLTPVPEPSSILALLFGLGGLASLSLRKRM